MIRLLCLVVLVGLSISGQGQTSDGDTWTKETGISLGAFNSNTDIGGQLVDLKSFKPGIGVYIAGLYRQQVGLRVEATLATVTASDSRAMNYNLKQRNLDFTSTIKEINLLGEVHPLNFFVTSGKLPALSPYILFGVGYFGFDPRTQLNGQWIYLQPLHTEGQGFEETGRPNYSLSALNFPVGGGLQYRLSDRFVVRGEAIYRLLNTDYLDDVSTTYIDPNLYDKYLSADNAKLAKLLADRQIEIPESGLRPSGSIRGSTKKDAFYSVNIKLGIRLFERSSHRQRVVAKHKQGCYAL